MRMDAAALTDRLFGLMKTKLASERQRLENIKARRDFSDAVGFFADEHALLNDLKTRLETISEKALHTRRIGFTGLASRLDSLNPLSVLLRGFAAVSVNGVIADRASALTAGEIAHIRFADGTVKAEIIGKVSENE